MEYLLLTFILVVCIILWIDVQQIKKTIRDNRREQMIRSVEADTDHRLLEESLLVDLNWVISTYNLLTEDLKLELKDNQGAYFKFLARKKHPFKIHEPLTIEQYLESGSAAIKKIRESTIKLKKGPIR